MSSPIKIIRITTAAVSMRIILRGQLNYMSNFYEVVGITANDNFHFPKIKEQEGIRLISLPLKRTINPIWDIISLINLIFIFIKEKPQIVHTHTPKAGLLGMIAAKLTNVPIRLHTVGGIPWMEIIGFKRNILKKIEKITYACSHRVYPNSKGLESFIIKEKICSKSKLKVLANGGSNGINTEYFIYDAEERKLIRNGLGLKEDDVVLGFVGRIAKEKGIEELIEAFEELQEKYKIKIILIGVFERIYGSLKIEIEKKIMSNKNIYFLGRFDDVRPYYSSMDIFVFPSYREGFPNAVLEASAMSLPIIATNINGCNEIINNGENGLLVSPKSKDELKFALIKLIENKYQRQLFGSKARENVIEKFKREKVWNCVKEEYDNFLTTL